MKQYKVARQWAGQQGPNGVIIDMSVQELDKQDATAWMEKSAANTTFSIDNEEFINRVIANYGLAHKQSLGGWIHFVQAHTLGAL